METKQVIVVRKDLKNAGWGKMSAQISHASVASVLSIFDNEDIDDDCYRLEVLVTYGSPLDAWLSNSFTKICVWAKDEEELLDIYMKARQADLPCSLIKDAGRTVFKGVPTFTTVGVGPGEISEIDKITGHLPLI